MRWFWRTQEQWVALRERLKRMSCPHCKVVGMLIRHGFLRGYDDQSPTRKTVRAYRIFCSNRHARRGCGRTFSVWRADKIRRLSLTTHSLWKFLQEAVSGSRVAAMRCLDSPLSDRTLQRVWRRFVLAQSAIRTALSQYGPPPDPPGTSALCPEAQVIAHLRAAFPDDDCPITAFQESMRTSFL